MATDNTSQSGDDTMRSIDRLGAGIKSMAVVIDRGGANTNAEILTVGYDPVRLVENRPDAVTVSARDTTFPFYDGSGVPQTGTPTANSFAAFFLAGGEREALLLLKGTLGGPVIFEKSADTDDGEDGEWVPCWADNRGVDPSIRVPLFFTSVAGLYRLRVAGAKCVRARSNAPFGSTPNFTVAASLTQASSTTEALILPSSDLNTPMMGTACLLFNGADWEKQHSNYNTTTGDSGTKVASFNGLAQTNGNARGAWIVFVIGTVTGSAPTLVGKVQFSPDNGTTWIDLPGAATSTITAAGTYALQIYPGVAAVANAAVSAALPRTWRVVGTIGGGSPSFPLTNVLVAYMN